MNKSSLTAIVLSLLVLAGWNIWYYDRYGDVLEENRQKAGQTVAAENRAQEAATPTDMGQPASPQSADPTAEPTSAKPKALLKPLDPTMDPTRQQASRPAAVDGERFTEIDTGVTRVTLSNRGGVITSWQLLGYKNDEGELIELVNPKSEFKPLTLEFASSDATYRVNAALFSGDMPERVELTPNSPTFTAEYIHQLETGFTLRKAVTFTYGTYRAEVAVALSHPGMDVTGSTFSIGWYGLGRNISSMYTYIGPVAYIDGERVAEQPDEGEKEVREGKVEWAGLINKYYVSTFLPEDTDTRVTFRQMRDGLYSTSLRLVAKGSGQPANVALYAGPKTVKHLKEQGRDLTKIINYGWFDVISKPLYRFLIFIYGITGNYGWSIVVLTFLVKLLFFPLTQKSFKSMSKMRKLQPKMKIIQDRYKNDKQKMNEELIALYRKNKVNPLSGCMPILLQIPVFIALYKVLLESIELKGAPFILWIADLSAKDPYYVTPVLMGLSMFVQQKLSPQANDPIQRNLMLIMPVVFVVMFINFPAGLVVYWLVNNLLTIVQQWYVNNHVKE